MRFEDIGAAKQQRDTFFGAMSDSTLYAPRSSPSSGESEEVRRYLQEFFHKEPCIYTHRVFIHAAQVFDALKHGPRDGNTQVKKLADERAREKSMEIPSIEFDDENEKRLTFALVFQTLKYQRFLEDMLEDCVFFAQYPEFKEDTSLVMVILCDFKQRKFQRRTPMNGEELRVYLVQIEEALYRCKTKLNAALARSRIKARVLSIDHLLPDSVRQNDKIGSNMHIYAWINQIRTNLNDIIDLLRKEAFTQVQYENKLVGKSYMLDHQCIDMVCFPYEQREFLEQHPLVVEGHIVLQDKSSCVGPHSVRALINEGDDVLHVNVGSGITTAHLASLTHNSDSEIYCFGIRSEKQQKHITAILERFGAKDRVKLFEDEFLEVDQNDERLKHIKVILITAECSRSGVANPVNFIVSEGEGLDDSAPKDMSILRDLSLGYTDEKKLGDLVVKHNSTLKHALNFPRVQAVVYCTRSLLEAENENVVTRAIEYVNMVKQKKTPYRIAPPVLPLSDRDIEMENPLNGKYLRYPPSSFMSGCFIATITREADDPKEAAKDILARAAARGIITGVPVQEKEKATKNKNKSGRKKEKSDKKHRKKSPPRPGSPRRTKSEKRDASEEKTPARQVVSMDYDVTRTAAASMPVKSFRSPAAAKRSLPVHLKMSPSNVDSDSDRHKKVTAKVSEYLLSRGAVVTNDMSSLSLSQSDRGLLRMPRFEKPAHKVVVQHPAPFR